MKGFTNLGNAEHLLSYLCDLLLTKILKTKFHTFAIYRTQFFLPQPFSVDCEGILSLPSISSFSAVVIQFVIYFVPTELSCFIRALGDAQQLMSKALLSHLYPWCEEI